MENQNITAQPATSSENNSNQGKKNNKCLGWKIATIVLIIILLLLLLTQCQCLKKCYFPTSEDQSSASDQVNNQSITPNNTNQNTNQQPEEKCSYLGKWLRTGTYLNNELVGTVPADLELKANSYYSATNVCFTQGALTITGNDMQMKIDDTDCPTGSIPTSYNYSYQLTCDGNNPTHLTLTINQDGSLIREEYDRAK